ncbi:MAG: UvrD-helicase domain-containing protein [Muribaculaceae bacterium]|nr:UvrD-helicase domain-containing protein [Muribaculaceae bacterium]
MSIKFDEFQQKIIDLNRGNCLVLAPPGCGKTAILAERVARAIESGRDPSKMLCLTFTNRASRGMKERIERRTGSDSEVFVGNTHRFCGHFLFENGIVEKSTGILDEQDCRSVLAELSGINDESRLNRDQSRLINDAFNVQHLIYQFRHHHPDIILQNVDREIIESMKGVAAELEMTPSRSVIVDIYDTIDTVIDKIGDSPYHSPILGVLRLARDYERYKQEHRIIDFDDMLLRTYDRLKSGEYRRYDWVQVDEVQDLNMLQLAIIELLVEQGDNSVSVFLGDEQQSIFSFIGAKGKTIDYLRNQCQENIYRLEKNYRSPGYLLEMTNSYAVENLGVDPNVLPTPSNYQAARGESMTIVCAADDRGAVERVVRRAKESPKERRLAVIVATNREADRLSEAMGDYPHFKISGTDFFSTDQMQLLLGHLSLVGNEHNPLAWGKILLGLKLAKNKTQARKIIARMMSASVSPTDMLIYDEESYLLEFVDDYEHKECVIFDTETTGLDVKQDDIVQIAAIKVKGGKVVDSLNVVMHTDKPIPPMLGDIPNPLIEEYAKSKHTARKEGLRQFLDFAGDVTLIGHNVEFDYNILRNNLKRDYPEGVERLKSRRFDTLKVARLLFPRLFSYKLKDLLTAFELEGENSHLADDDIVATKSVADYFTEYFNRDVRAAHEKMLQDAADFRKKFRDCYGELYRSGVERLYEEAERPLSGELMRAYNNFLGRKIITAPLDKLRYVVKFLDGRFGEPMSSLRKRLDVVGSDLNTFRESDLCEGDIVDESVFITTVHKAKGLEFDDVIIFGAVDGTYPFFMSETEDERMEDARKLYVALTRARQSLTIMTYERYIAETQYGIKMYDKEMSPFLVPVLKYFK